MDKRYIFYQVGAFLFFPLYCCHVIVAEKEEPNSREFQEKQPLLTAISRYNIPSQQGVKRSCGQSQRSARMKYSHVPSLKKK